MCDLSPFQTFEGEEALNLRTNSFQEGEDDAREIVPRLFTRSQVREHQRMRGQFMKLEFFELALKSKEGFYVKRPQNVPKKVPRKCPKS